MGVGRDGYAWWYVDALSADGRQGLTIIAFVGSVFSPYYAWARRRGRGDPLDHCCVNVALYGRPSRWAMTERGRGAVDRGATHFMVGRSALHWDGAALSIWVEERGAPVPRAISGMVRVVPRALTGRTFALDAAGRHRWSPIAPVCDVAVTMTSPGVAWEGIGYLDSNEGDAPLEQDFAEWDWLRAPAGDGAVISYNAQRRDGGEQALALRVDGRGGVAAFPPPPRAALPRTLWGMRPVTRCDAGSVPLRRRTLEDAPFYSRSVVETRLGGERVVGVHEHLSLPRFTHPAVQAMLPFRMPRWG